MTCKEMRERRGKVAHDMAELANNLTPENRVKFDTLDTEQKDLKEQIDRIERAEALEAETRATGKPPEAQPGTGNDADVKAKADDEKYQKAFRSYLKYGWTARPDRGIAGISQEARSILNSRVGLWRGVQVNPEDLKRAADSPDEFRDMGTGNQGAYPGATTGFFVPVGFTQKVEVALKYYGDMLNVGEIMETATGQPLPYPTSNDTNITGELIGENQQVTTADVTLGQIMFGAYKFSTKLVKVSIELLQDSAFDIEKFLVQQFAIRLGRTLNAYFTTGTGTNQPKGIITAATVGVSTTTTPAITGDDNASPPDPTVQVGYIDLVNLEHSVDPLYRRTYNLKPEGLNPVTSGGGAKYMFHDSTLRFIKTLKDKYGRPLWTPGIAINAPDTINGYTYSINNDMAVLAAGATTVAFGALDKYLIRRVKDLAVLRLDERFADYGQVAFLGFARYDGNLLDAGSNPVKTLVQHT